MASTVYETFADVAKRWPDRPFVAVGPLASRSYLPTGIEISYAEATERVGQLREAYASAGYGVGHRVGLLLENRPEHHLHFLALNSLGIGAVPINPDYRPDESRYLIEHSELCLIVALPHRLDDLGAVAAQCAQRPPLRAVGDPRALPPAPSAARREQPGPGTETTLFYTSGTTGRPKGCVVTNDYYDLVGELYRTRGGLLELREAEERIYNPLPLFHINAGVFSFMGALTTGGCSILPDRFHPNSWWQELADARATIFHYLGIIPAMLMKLPPGPQDRAHGVRLGVGAGCEPNLHRAFEERFGLPLIELWGMTETGGGFIASVEPRLIDTRAFGRPGASPGLELEARVVDAEEADVPLGQAGQLLVRRSGDDPRRGFFREYLKNEEATAEAWLGGWFHTGDVVTQDETGMLFFVDRNKNIIRRSGENISAAEVEATLLGHEGVLEVAVIAVPDDIREEEVMACVVPKEGYAAGEALAQALFDHANARLSYYKPPGWVLFVPALPKTSTQKVQKTEIVAKGARPEALAGAIDLRARKKRTGPGR
ncbi:AMP-binding protein [Chelatococcus reniformis]|uniref:ATP-dependent acyl-CoA ligase n=1 Tax=Chelatococcus reniformis TaxID=1494448 RepID=A0A916UB48_9HYPH|nr:AMP-binding protein [Chelatococcus reniformis]GGC65857.1 ATP-dependent acyl-CoA ligase [Chelatococcus reniformis]